MRIKIGYSANQCGRVFYLFTGKCDVRVILVDVNLEKPTKNICFSGRKANNINDFAVYNFGETLYNKRVK